MASRTLQVVLRGDKTNLTRTLHTAAADVKGFQRDVDGTTSRAGSGAKLMGAAFLAAGAAVALGLGYGVAKAAEFDRSMRNVNSITGLSEGAFASMEKQVISMSTRLPQSAKELADGLYDIASSGFYGADGLTVLAASAQAASAGLSTTANSAKAITAVLNAYGLEAKDANDVSDVLFQTVNLGVVSFDELTGVIGDVVGTAAAAKVGIDQVGSAIATMTLSGISAAEAGTSLNRVLQSIIQPSDSLQALLERLGYQSGAAALQQDGLRGVMEKVRKATGGNVTELLKLFPEIRAARGALALMSAEGENYNKVATGIEDKNARAGATARALKEQMKALSNQVTLAKNQLDATAITVGIRLLPAMLALLSGARALGHELASGVSYTAEALGPTFEHLASAAQNVWDVLTSLTSAVAPLVQILAALALTPVVATLQILASLLDSLTGLMADHQTIVMALAAAYGIHLVRALLAAQGGLSVMAWRALGAALDFIIGKTDAATAALNRMRIAEGAATLGVAVAIGSAITAWQRYSEVQGDVADALERTRKALRSTDLGEIEKQRQNLEQLRTTLTGITDKYESRGFLSRIFHPGDNAAAAAAYQGLTQVDGAIEKLDARAETMKFNLAQWLHDSMPPAAFEALLHNQTAFDNAMASTAATAKTAGIDLSGSYAVVKSALVAYTATHGPAVQAEQKLIAAMGELANSADEGNTAVQDLKDALDGLIGGPISQEEALIKWKDALDAITASVKENGTSLSINTAAGRANRESIIGSVKALKDRIETEAQAGASGKTLGAILQSGTKDLVDQATKAGLNKKQIEALVRQYGLTPKLINTVIQNNADAVKAKVEALQREVDRLHGREIGITATVKWQGTTAYVQLRGGKAVVNDRGNIMVERYAQGGTRLPRVATIAKGGPTLVQWAEPNTGGEAFIPLGAHNRPRSKAILSQVAGMFGMAVQEKMAVGGMMTDRRIGSTAPRVSASGGVTIINTVQVQVDRAGAGADEIAKAAATATEQSMGKLLERLRAGAGGRN